MIIGSVRMQRVVLGVAAASLLVSVGCTIHHSKVALSDGREGVPSSDAVFVTEDDSGMALLGFFVVTEPDHYAILIERARKRYKCTSLSHIQLDFYTDFWIFVGFPIARITAICEQGGARNKKMRHGKGRYKKGHYKKGHHGKGHYGKGLNNKGHHKKGHHKKGHHKGEYKKGLHKKHPDPEATPSPPAPAPPPAPADPKKLD